MGNDAALQHIRLPCTSALLCYARHKMHLCIGVCSACCSQAANASARVKAHPVSPGQRATDLVNYALALPRTGSFLHTQGQNMSWWQVGGWREVFMF